MGARAKMFVSLLGFLVSVTLVSCNSEGDILYEQKQAWTDPRNVLQSWNESLPNPCTWFHVTCNSNNSVIRVDLGNAGLSGPLIPQLGGLTYLQYLELFNNNISGVIPTTMGNLSSLISLNLGFNILSGAIPSSLGYLESLQFLILKANNLTGVIPSSLGNLSSLINLDLQLNSLSGSIPSSLGNITSLQSLRLNGNALSGTLPLEVLSLVITGNLTILNVSDNFLYGKNSTAIKVSTIIQDA